MLERGTHAAGCIFTIRSLLRTFGKACTSPSRTLKRRPLLDLAEVANDLPASCRSIRGSSSSGTNSTGCAPGIYEKAVRPYMLAVKKHTPSPQEPLLATQHEIRVRCARSACSD